MEPVVVIGGGIIGTSIAYQLAQRDLPVVLFEKNSLGSGTTSKSMAIFFWYQEEPSPVEHRLRERSWETYGRLVDQGTISFTQIGTLHTAPEPEDVEPVREIHEGLEAIGVEAEWLEPHELEASGLTPEHFEGALHVPADGYLDPSEIIQYFVGEVTANGGRVETGIEVTDIRTEDGEVIGVETTEGVQEASAVVNAAGPWAPQVNELVGVDLPLRHTRGPIVVLSREEPFDLPFMILSEDLYFREESTSQAFGGRFDTYYETAETLNPDANLSIDHDFLLDIAEQIEANVPRLADASVVNDWVGIRCVTPDHRPFVGETEVPGFYTAVGMTGYGVTRAPAVGDILASMIAGEDVEADFAEWMAVDRM